MGEESAPSGSRTGRSSRSDRPTRRRCSRATASHALRGGHTSLTCMPWEQVQFHTVHVDHHRLSEEMRHDPATSLLVF